MHVLCAGGQRQTLCLNKYPSGPWPPTRVLYDAGLGGWRSCCCTNIHRYMHTYPLELHVGLKLEIPCDVRTWVKYERQLKTYDFHRVYLVHPTLHLLPVHFIFFSSFVMPPISSLYIYIYFCAYTKEHSVISFKWIIHPPLPSRLFNSSESF